MKKEFTRSGNTIVFFQKENDEKFSFIVKNNEPLTERLLMGVKTKRVKEKNIHYAVNGIFDKIEEIIMQGDDFEIYENTINNLLNKNNNNMNPIVELSEKCQKKFGASIETYVIGKSGADHCPVITVQIDLPNGDTYRASGSNQKTAKQKAAEKALAEW